jgi:hypothetical protein
VGQGEERGGNVLVLEWAIAFLIHGRWEVVGLFYAMIDSCWGSDLAFMFSSGEVEDGGSGRELDL